MILEIFMDKEEYDIKREEYIQKNDIEIVEANDEKLQICYERLNLGDDVGLSYQEIYKKYMGIIGAYEVI